MRTKNSIINMSVAFGAQLIMILIGLVSRTIFIQALGAEYLGVNGLFSNILSIVSLAESGIGASIVYSLYKPVAENDEDRILVLMRLYKITFRVIGVVVFLLGLAVMPFLNKFINGETSVQQLYFIYFIFVVNASVSYLFSYRISFLNVCQKNYIVSSVSLVFSIIASITKIIILYTTQNYILYLVIDGLITIMSSIAISNMTTRLYPYLKNSTNSKLDKETKATIINNIKGLILHNIGGRMVFATDNLLISSFVSLLAVGLYSNYSMLIQFARTLINNIFNGIDHSMGNLIAEGNKESIYKMFRVLMFCGFWINSFFAIGMYVCMEDTIGLWLGKEFLFGKGVLSILMISFYISGMRRAIDMVRTKSGIFYEGRYAPLIEALVNLITSIILVKYIGISGIFIGTIISTLAVPFWLTPYLVYKRVYNKSCRDYFEIYFKYAIIFVVTCGITSFIINHIVVTGIVGLIVKCIACTFVINTIYFLLFRKTEEFMYILNVFKELILNKFRPNKDIYQEV